MGADTEFSPEYQKNTLLLMGASQSLRYMRAAMASDSGLTILDTFTPSYNGRRLYEWRHTGAGWMENTPMRRHCDDPPDNCCKRYDDGADDNNVVGAAGLRGKTLVVKSCFLIFCDEAEEVMITFEKNDDSAAELAVLINAAISAEDRFGAGFAFESAGKLVLDGADFGGPQAVLTDTQFEIVGGTALDILGLDDKIGVHGRTSCLAFPPLLFWGWLEYLAPEWVLIGESAIWNDLSLIWRATHNAWQGIVPYNGDNGPRFAFDTTDDGAVDDGYQRFGDTDDIVAARLKTIEDLADRYFLMLVRLRDVYGIKPIMIFDSAKTPTGAHGDPASCRYSNVRYPYKCPDSNPDAPAGFRNAGCSARTAAENGGATEFLLTSCFNDNYQYFWAYLKPKALAAGFPVIDNFGKSNDIATAEQWAERYTGADDWHYAFGEKAAMYWKEQILPELKIITGH